MLSQRELDVMRILYEAGEPLTSTGITERMTGLTQSTVIAVVRSLLRQGMLEEAGVTHSGKVLSRLFSTTEKGKKVILEHFTEYYRSASHIIPASEMCKCILEAGEITKEDIADIRRMLETF